MDSSIIPFQVQVEEIITLMNRELYEAAEDGNIESFSTYQGSLHCLVDGRQNTPLHIYLKASGGQQLTSIHFVQQLVGKCPSLLLQPNDKGEIPLHIAARNSNQKIVKFLIERAKEVSLPQPHEDLEKGTTSTTTSSEETGSWVRKMMRMKDCEGNTAFHKAAGSDDVNVVRLLVKELDPEVSLSANNSKETPLYIAAKNTCPLVVAEILNNCKSIKDYGGPHGTTALHAAVFEDGKNDIINRLIEAKKELTKKTDDKGRTPLHHAAYFGCSDTVDQLLEEDASAAYVKDKARGMTALHMATLKHCTYVMEVIISHCPGCFEMVDNRGWNYFHFAMAILSDIEIKRFLQGIENMIKDSTITNLLHDKDVDGIRPFDVAFHCMSIKVLDLFRPPDSYFLRHANINKEQIKKVLEDIVDKVEVVGVPIHGLRQKIKKMEEKAIPEHEILEKGREAHLLVAALVATVTFAAAFTAPGGYDDKKGTAILSGEEAFKAFVVADTVAFVSSILAIFVHFLYQSLIKRGRSVLVWWLRLADWLTFLAMIAMVVAFSTGTYAVLKSSSMGFAIVTCLFGLIFFPGLLLVSYNIFLPYFPLTWRMYAYRIFFLLEDLLGRGNI